MRKRTALKILSVLICFAMLFSALPVGAGNASKAQFVSRLNFDLADDAVVRAIIIYSGDSALEAVNKGNAASVAAESKTVSAGQKALTKEITKRGAALAYSYSTLLNGVAVDASYKQLKEIEKLSGVKGVYLANTYSAPVVSESAKAASITDTYGQVPNKGNGAVIAVLDTGFRVTHEVFSTYNVSQTLSKSRMESIRDSAKGLNGHGVYVSAKIPFAYDYFDRDTDVSGSSHGTAVAGIAAGNAGSYNGIAPYAQLLLMKVFDESTGTTDSSIYFAALEDAYSLGADAVNMSYGAQNGFVFDYELETEVFGNIYETLKNAGVFVLAAAGNEFSQGYGDFAYNHASADKGINAVTADYADYGVVSSPASYNDVIAVGSVDGNAAPSAFSSWGCTPELTLKPQICGVGGGVNCPDISSDFSYRISSGTSMAAPVVTGYFASLKVYLKGNAQYSGFTGSRMYELVYGVMLSSAQYSSTVSPRKQGAGIANAAYLSPVYFSEPIVNLGDDKGKSGTYSFTVTAYSVNEGTVLTLGQADILADALTEYGGEKYNTLTSVKLSATVTTDKKSYTLSLTPTKITVTVKLSDAAKKHLNAFPNGGFVEGYIKFSASGTEYAPHLTLMGFYGDWNSAPALEKYDWSDIVDAEAFLNTEIYEGTGLTYAESGFTVYDILDMNVGYTEGYLINADMEVVGVLGDNLYDWIKFDKKRMAFSTADADGLHLAEGFLILPALLRNARHIIMTVTDAKTGEVYYVDDTEYAMKNYYDTAEKAFIAGTMFAWDGTYEDEKGNIKYVANDTEVKVTFQTQLAYDGAPLITALEYTMVVDNEAPKINYDWDKNTMKLTVRATDNQYISNIFVYNGDYEVMHVNATIENDERYKEYVAVYDLSGADFEGNSTITLEVQDYATNYSTVEIHLSFDKGDVNMDGVVDNSDAALILKYDAGLIDLHNDAMVLGDVNGDGEVNNADAARILRYDSGLIDSL